MVRRFLLMAAALALLAGAARADYSLTILHTNDFHSRFEPIDRFDRDCPAELNAAGECFGGAARLMTAISKARARSDNSILLDAGDQFPARYSSTKAQPELLATLMNRMGYDAMALGSHEFDEGFDVARRFVDGLDFPALMANADLSVDPYLAARIMNSVVIDRDGERLGVIGLTPVGSDCWTGPDAIAVTDPIAAVQTEVDRLSAAGVDKIILLSHSGYRPDQRIAQETTGVDVIVGGHSHTYLSNSLTHSQGPYPTMVNGVAIVHAFPFGSTLGELTVRFDDAGNLIEATGDQVVLDGSVPEDAGIKALIAEAAPLD